MIASTKTHQQGEMRSTHYVSDSARARDKRRRATQDSIPPAKVAALKIYLESLNEDERADYVAAANDFASAMQALGADSIRACYRGGSVERGNTPEGVRSIEEMRSLTLMLRSLPATKTTEAPIDEKASLPGDSDD